MVSLRGGKVGFPRGAYIIPEHRLDLESVGVKKATWGYGDGVLKTPHYGGRKGYSRGYGVRVEKWSEDKNKKKKNPSGVKRKEKLNVGKNQEECGGRAGMAEG